MKSRFFRALVTTVAVGALTVAAAPAQAATNGQQKVRGYTKAECETKGGKVARKKMNQGYTVTFVGCAFDGFSDPPYVGTVFWRTGRP